jgi:hypothetical protein
VTALQFLWAQGAWCIHVMLTTSGNFVDPINHKCHAVTQGVTRLSRSPFHLKTL